MKVHELKVWPEYFEELLKGNKTFEIRKNDRDYKIGDIILLQEYDPNKSYVCHICDCHKYTGRELKYKVTYITDFGLQENFVCMGIKLI